MGMKSIEEDGVVYSVKSSTKAKEDKKNRFIVVK